MRQREEIYKKAFFVLFVWAVIFCNDCLARYSGGSGEPGDPYRISTPEDLNDIGNHTEDFNKAFVMTNDIDMSAYTGTQYKIIGFNSPFTGTFDGNEHIVHHLSYNTSSSTSVGLFSNTKNAVIKNLGLEDVNFFCAGGRAGSLAAYQDHSDISNCYSTGTVASITPNTTFSDESTAGGLVGYQNYGNITDCCSAVSVTSFSYDYESSAGGIAGSQSNGNMVNSHSTGAVISSTTISSVAYVFISCAGGLAAGMSDVNVINCYSTGSVSSSAVISYAGGLAGSQSGCNIANSYSTSSVSSSGDARSYAGGLVGYNNGTITNCRSLSSVNSSGNESYAGGVAGVHGSAVIMDCCSWAEVNCTTNLYYSYSGGLAGYQNTGSLLRCRNSGSVNCYSNNAYSYAGGLSGYLENGTISECYNTGSINSFSPGIPSTNAIVNSVSGGLVGFLKYNGTINNSYNTGPVGSNGSKACSGGVAGFSIGFSDSKIIKCYSTSEVNATGHTVYEGGLLGLDYYKSTVITVSFWDTQTSGLVESDGGLGLTTSRMQEAYNYQANGWSGTTWTLDEGNDYPHLAWENAPGEFINAPVVSMAGSGSAEDPFVIETKEDFLKVCSGVFFWDKHYVLNTSIDLSGVTFSRGLIGYGGNPFTGSFNGGGHVINNITIQGKNYLGLFGCIGPNSIVSNLGVAGVDINGTGDYIGGLAGYVKGGIVVNCFAAGTILSDANYIGGLVGYADNGAGYADKGNITNCYTAALVKGYDWVGGLLGIARYTNVSNCFARGEVISTCPFFYKWAGGLVAEVADGGVVTNSFWDIQTSGITEPYGGTGKTTDEMKIKSTFTDAGWDFNTPVWKIYDGRSYPYLGWEKYGGGSGMQTNPYMIWTADDLLAMAADTNDYDKCFALNNDINLGAYSFTNSVIAFDTNETFAGVFDGAGYKIVNLTINANEIGKKYLGLFGNISDGGKIKNLGLENVSITGGDDSENIGALAGFSNGGSISDCYSSGTVSGGSGSFAVGGLVGENRAGFISECQTDGTVKGSEYTGGLAGINHYGNITKCFSNSNVSGLFAAGGLVGSLEDASVTDSYSTGMVSGNENTGGFVGINKSDCNIFRCYSAGKVQGAIAMGGFAGYHSPGCSIDYRGCFSNSSINPGINGIGNAVESNVIGLPARQLHNKNTFVNAGWDFNEVWIIHGNNYPKLAWYNAITVTKCKITAGNEMGSDYFSISGFLNALPGDFNKTDFIGIAIYPQNNPYPLAAVLPVNRQTFKNGKYKYTVTADKAKMSFTLDTKTSKFSLWGSKINLSGLSCPLIVRIDIGDFTASAYLDEQIVNGAQKPIPIRLLMGVENSLRIDKFQVQRGSKPYTDKLTVKGGFSVREIIDMTTNDFVIKLGSQFFTIKQYNFIINRNGFACSKIYLEQGGIASANFNFNTCTFKITITNTTISESSSSAEFKMEFADFREIQVVSLP